MELIDIERIEQYKRIYLQLYGEKLSTSEAEAQLQELGFVLQVKRIKRNISKNGK